VRIDCIEAIPVAYPEPNDCNAERHLCLVRMQADDGQVGWGDGLGIHALEAVVSHYRLDKQA